MPGGSAGGSGVGAGEGGEEGEGEGEGVGGGEGEGVGVGVGVGEGEGEGEGELGGGKRVEEWNSDGRWSATACNEVGEAVNFPAPAKLAINELPVGNDKSFAPTVEPEEEVREASDLAGRTTCVAIRTKASNRVRGKTVLWRYREEMRHTEAMNLAVKMKGRWSIYAVQAYSIASCRVW